MDEFRTIAQTNEQALLVPSLSIFKRISLNICQTPRHANYVLNEKETNE